MTEKAKLYTALRKAQQAMSGAAKDATNPHFRSKYADLGAVQDACISALHDNGFAVFQPVITDETGHWVRTVFAHESSEAISCNVPLILGKHDMQGLGSAITYARRYGLLCMSGVAPEDDDGNKAAEQGGKAPPRRVTSKAEDQVWGPEIAPIDVSLENTIKLALITIKNIDDLDELKAYWDALNKENRAVADDKRVVNAKDERKADLLRAQRDAK